MVTVASTGGTSTHTNKVSFTVIARKQNLYLEYFKSYVTMYYSMYI
jgi:hypothetical protein